MINRVTTKQERETCSIAEAKQGVTYRAPSDHSAIAVRKLKSSEARCDVLWYFHDMTAETTLSPEAADRWMVSEFAEGEQLIQEF